MLGWEYPPHITGGLGTACEGLTKALSRLGVKVDFIVPTLLGGEEAEHMSIFASDYALNDGGPFIGASLNSNSSLAVPSNGASVIDTKSNTLTSIETHRIPALLSPYWSEADFDLYLETLKSSITDKSILERFIPLQLHSSLNDHGGGGGRLGGRYSRSIFNEVATYAANVLSLSLRRQFDVIHAHDWMTFPAAVALKKLTGKPLVVHVHSLEYDRSGEAGNSQIKEIEGLGVTMADRVIAVSCYTKGLVVREHSVEGERIAVVHNGVYPKVAVEAYRNEVNKVSKVTAARKTVLFLGRVTFQKGPDYFVEAAARVVPHVPDVLFVMAGTGDMLPRMINRVQELGIERNFEFTGFLRGEEVERIFTLADLYVMPSVSEPFGITALEAISHETPVILSRQSGVSEVLKHALKVDFWDIDKMADLIINGLIHNELRQDMLVMAREEIKKVRWDAAALKVETLYQELGLQAKTL
jgi:glycosyltransferase involved in cell wall biosynthesis